MSVNSTSPQPHSERRILAAVLPDLLSELAQQNLSLNRAVQGSLSKRKERPLIVIVDEESEPNAPAQSTTRETAQNLAQPSRSAAQGVLRAKTASPHTSAEIAQNQLNQSISPLEISAKTLISAVNSAARQLGICPGQTVAEACALVTGLCVKKVSKSSVQAALNRIAELALGFGPNVATAEPDTVWVDITGSAHLWGGEEELLQAFSEQVRAMGHNVRIAISTGPILSQAFARFGRLSTPSQRIITASQLKTRLAELPLLALPLGAAEAELFARLGILTIGQLNTLDLRATALRLGKNAQEILNLCKGQDNAPLLPHTFPRIIEEHHAWEEPLAGIEPLRFVAKRLTTQISARLEGRREAACNLLCELSLDPKIARFRGVNNKLCLDFALAAPLHKQEQLYSILMTQLERLALPAPTLAMKLQVTEITSAVPQQLELSPVGDRTAQAEAAFPVVLAEIISEVGPDKVGTLRIVDAHRPELKSLLSPLTERLPSAPQRLRKAQPRLAPTAMPWAPTRIFPQPLPVDVNFRIGASLPLGYNLYTIEKVEFMERLDGVEWWSQSPAQRDYFRLWLTNTEGGLEALAYIEHENGRRFVQGIAD